MTWSLNTGAPYHTQDTSYYCGAAVAMTVLAEIGVPHSQLDQDVLYASNHAHNHNAAWYTDCYGLQYTLVNRKPASFGNTFVVHKRLNELDGTRDVVYTLRTYGVAPCVLVFGCAHWNTVIGAQTNTDPAFGAYTVDGFWINNPVWYDTPPPPPHGAADSCGSGGAHGIASEFITYSTWQSTYFTGCAFDDPGGATQWISVCDPDERSIESPTGRADRQRANGRRLLRPSHGGVLRARTGRRQVREDLPVDPHVQRVVPCRELEEGQMRRVRLAAWLPNERRRDAVRVWADGDRAELVCELEALVVDEPSHGVEFREPCSNRPIEHLQAGERPEARVHLREPERASGGFPRSEVVPRVATVESKHELGRAHSTGPEHPRGQLRLG